MSVSVVSLDFEIPLPDPFFERFLYPVILNFQDVDHQPVQDKCYRSFISFSACIGYDVYSMDFHAVEIQGNPSVGPFPLS